MSMGKCAKKCNFLEYCRETRKSRKIFTNYGYLLEIVPFIRQNDFENRCLWTDNRRLLHVTPRLRRCAPSLRMTLRINTPDSAWASWGGVRAAQLPNVTPRRSGAQRETRIRHAGFFDSLCSPRMTRGNTGRQDDTARCKRTRNDVRRKEPPEHSLRGLQEAQPKKLRRRTSRWCRLPSA